MDNTVQEKRIMVTVNEFLASLSTSFSVTGEQELSIKETLCTTPAEAEYTLLEEYEDAEWWIEEVEVTSVTFHPWEETGMTNQELWEKLTPQFRRDLIEGWDIPTCLWDTFPGDLSIPKAVIKLLKELPTMRQQYNTLALYRAGWTVDWLRKVVGGEFYVSTYTSIGGRRKLTTFFSNHHQKVVLNLLTHKEKKAVLGGEERTLATNAIFEELVEVWHWLYLNHPESLKGIRVRDIFSYYEDLRKLKIELEPSYELYQDEEVVELLPKKWEGYDVVFPSESKQLKEWGRLLDHCVGGYGEMINGRDCIIVSLNKGDEPIWTIELKRNPNLYVAQFMGYHNSDPPDGMRERFEVLLE